MTSPYHNTLALQNWCAAGTPNLQWYEAGEWANGSQWTDGQNAGDPTTVSSVGPGYVYMASDLTNLYNRPNFWTPSAAATDITQATRSLVWLDNAYIVVYDRAASLNSGLFKRFHLSVINNPVIQGNVTVETLNSWSDGAGRAERQPDRPAAGRHGRDDGYGGSAAHHLLNAACAAALHQP